MPMVRATRALECLAQSLLIVAALIRSVAGVCSDATGTVARPCWGSPSTRARIHYEAANPRGLAHTSPSVAARFRSQATQAHPLGYSKLSLCQRQYAASSFGGQG